MENSSISTTMTNLVVDISPEYSHRRKQLDEILRCVCALLNSGGGTLTLVDEHVTFSSIDQLIRQIGGRSLNMISEIRKCDHKFVITINARNHPVVLRWNLFLSSNTQVVEVPPYEPIETIKKIMQGNDVLTNLTPIQIHCKNFIVDQTTDFGESAAIQVKHLETSGRRTKHVSFADHMLSQSDKFCAYISAFANCSGGHIYYGVTDDGDVKGQRIYEFDKKEIILKIEKTINEMVWPHHLGSGPKRGTQWDVFFEPVKDDNGDIIPSVFVIDVFVARCPGGVFIKEPESYYMVNGEVVKMSYPDLLHLLSSPAQDPMSTLLQRSVVEAVCQKLNILRPLGGDFKALGKLIGMSDVDIERISLRSNPAASLFSFWERKETVTISRLRYLLLRLGRNDVVEILDKTLQTVTFYEAGSGVHPLHKELPEEFERVPWSEVCQKEIDVLLLTAGNVEFIEATKVLKDPKEADSIGRVGSVVFGTVGENCVAVLKTSPSTADVMVTCLNAFNELSIKSVVSLGTCIGFKKKEHMLGDVLVSTNLAICNQRPVRQGSTVWFSGKVASCNGKFVKLFESEGLHGPDVHSGLLISGPHVIKDKSLMKFLKRSYDEVLGLETEGEGLYSYCNNFGIPWMICKAIASWADDDWHESNEWRTDDDGRGHKLSDHIAAAKSASFVQDVLSRNSIRDTLLESPDDSSDYFSGQSSQYAESVASNERLFELPDHCDQDPFERAFLFEENLSDDCTEYLQGLDWVEDFYIAEANEECKTCHLEIVCKFGNVPRIIDIVVHFGEDALPFVTYKAERGTKLDCFINQDGILKDEFDTALRSIDWVESYKTGVVIACKDDNVPSIGDLGRKISMDILPYVEFTNIKQLELQESDEESESDNEECTEGGSDDEESDEEPESDYEEYTESGSDDEGIKRRSDEEPENDYEECTESGSDDEEQNDEQNGKVDEEKNPSSSDHEDVSSPSWFESTVLTSDYEVKKEHKEELRRLGWVKACAVGVPNKEHDGLHLLLFCKNGKMPCMAQLKKWFGVKIVSYVEFMAEITDFKFEMNPNQHSESPDGESSLGESSLGESSAPEECQAMCVMSGDAIYEKKQGSNGYGTVGFFVRTNNNPDKLLLATCYHVCYRGKKLPNNKQKAHKILINDSKNKKSHTRKGSFWSLNRRKRKEEQRQKDVEERNEGKVPEQKKGTEGYVEMEINKKDCSNSTENVVPEGPEKKVRQSDNLNMQKKDNNNGEKIEVDENCKDDRERDEQKQNFDKRLEQKTMKPEGKAKERKFERIKLGRYSWGKYDDEHDICFVEQSPDIKCECLTPDDFFNPKMPILDKREFLHNSKQAIKDEIKSGSREVEKRGYTTETRKGQLLCFGYCDLRKRSGKDDALLVKDKYRNQPFSLLGDSGSLVSLVTREDKRIPIAYLKQLATMKKNGGGERNVHLCLCLVDLFKTCREDNNVGELQLHLTGCAYNGPAFEMKYE